MRESNIGGLEHFDKLFRVWTNGGQIIPEWKHTSSCSNTLAFNIWSQSSSNNYFCKSGGYEQAGLIPNNTWHCYEVMLDLTGEQMSFWFDGVLQGTRNATLPGSTFSYFTIGGNSSGHDWSGSTRHYRDFDDIIVSTQYVGPSGAAITTTTSAGTTSTTSSPTTTTSAAADTTPPDPPTGLQIGE